MTTAMQHGAFPLDDLTYDVVSILHEKSHALATYDKYIQDAQADPDCARVIEEIRRRDEEDCQKLRYELSRLLGQIQSGAV